MAVAYRSVQETDFGVGSSTASPVVNAPSGIQNGDLILVFFQTEGNHDSQTVSGWNRIGEIDETADGTASLYWKLANNEGSSWTFTNVFAAGEIGRAVAIAYSGVHQTSPVNASNSVYTASNAVSGPSVTPTVNNCMIVQFVGCDPGTTDYSGTADSSPTGTERFDAKDVNNNGYVFIQEYLQGTAEAIALDATFAGSDNYGHFQVAIAPDASTPTLTVADAYVTSQADTVTLTQAHNLIVADGYVTSQADAPALAQVHNLIPADTVVTTQADALMLTGTTTLAVADVYVLPAADAVAFVTALIALTVRMRPMTLTLEDRSTAFTVRTRPTTLTVEDQ